MRFLFGAGVVTALLTLAIAAFAQSTSAPATAVPASANPAAAAPLAIGKRLACRTGSQGMNGQAQKDQMQLCMAQARVDCLKQAIDQNIVGPQRKDFVNSCVQ
jgi:hypothetical protein